MDEIASDHAVMHGLLSFQHNRRNLNLSHKRIHRNVNRGTRSISLLDRRGLINAPRFPTRKSSISPLPHHRRHDVDSADTLAMLMHLMKKDDADDPFCAMFLPTTYKSTHHHSSSMIWQHLQHTVPLRVQSFSRNNVGKVLLTLQYHADESKLSVDIVQIKDIIGRQNCASKIYFKQTMEFNVPIALYHSNDTNLLIKVCQDIRKTTEIGHFIIGPQGNSVGAQHWKRIFSIPNISFSAWHTLTATINFPNKFLKM
ncbi:Synaptotagmin-12 [Dirofilaria immitis]